MSTSTKNLLWNLIASGLVAVAASTGSSDGAVAVQASVGVDNPASLSHRGRSIQIQDAVGQQRPPQPRRARRRRRRVQASNELSQPPARRRQLDFDLKTLADLDLDDESSAPTVSHLTSQLLPLPTDMLPHLPPRLLDESSSSHNNEVDGDDATSLPIEPRIINGLPTAPNRYPYLSSLIQNFDMKHMCGGTLIAPDIILTAGHCSGAFDTIQVGRYDRVNQQVGTFDHLLVEKHMVHPGFSNVIMNDFALAKLYGTSTVEPVRINNRRNLPSVGETLSVMGWGVTVEGMTETSSDVLRSINVSALSNDACNNSTGMYQGKFVSMAGYIVDNMLCAWNANQDACQGDSGGPLIYTDNERDEDIQVGIVSWGLGCANFFPGVYSRISSEYSWIRETVCANSVSPPSYFVCDGGVVSTSGWAMATSEVTIAIELDGAPEDTSFVLEEDPESVIAMGRTALIDGLSHVPFDTFNATLSTVKRDIFVAPNKLYRLTVLDRGFNGIQPKSGLDRQSRFRMCHGNVSGDECINAATDSGVVICTGAGDFDVSRSVYCFVEQVGTLTPSTSPTVMQKPPTYAPLVLPFWDDDRLPTMSPSLVPTPEPSAQVTMEPSIVNGTAAPTKLVPTSFLLGTSLQALSEPGEAGEGVSNDIVVEVNQTIAEANSTIVEVNETVANQPVNTSLGTTDSSSAGRAHGVVSMVAMAISTVVFAI